MSTVFSFLALFGLLLALFGSLIFLISWVAFGKTTFGEIALGVGTFSLVSGFAARLIPECWHCVRWPRVAARVIGYESDLFKIEFFLPDGQTSIRTTLYNNDPYRPAQYRYPVGSEVMIAYSLNSPESVTEPHTVIVGFFALFTTFVSLGYLYLFWSWPWSL